MTPDILIGYGAEVKALGDGRIGGHGVTFLSKDMEGEWFTSETYLGAHEGNGVDCLFHHSLPVKGMKAEYSEHLFAPVKARRDDIGIFVETVLNMADEYEKVIYDMVQAGKLGWSSGASPHMVRQTAKGMITRWPIVEFSLTPQPAEPKNKIYTLKSLMDEEADISMLKPAIKLTTIRDFEESLRELGVSKKDAMLLASHGYKGLRRDADEDTQRRAYARILESRIAAGDL